MTWKYALESGRVFANDACGSQQFSSYFPAPCSFGTVNLAYPDLCPQKRTKTLCRLHATQRAQALAHRACGAGLLLSITHKERKVRKRSRRIVIRRPIHIGGHQNFFPVATRLPCAASARSGNRQCTVRFTTAADRSQNSSPGAVPATPSRAVVDEKRYVLDRASRSLPPSAQALERGSVDALCSHCSTPLTRRRRCSWSSPCSVKRNR